MEDKPLLAMKGIVKEFPGVKALKAVDFSLQPGEIHALLGENGAGKSTLMKVLSGVYSQDAGEIWLDGRQVRFNGPREAQALGIGIIHQELNLVPELTVMENIFLGREPRHSLGFVDKRTMERETAAVLAKLGTDIRPGTVVSELSIGAQQMVEIAKALAGRTRILIMDEPTAALTERETERLFAIIRQLAAEGVGIVYISHRMEELFAVSQRITVMRDGSYIGTVPTGEISFDQLVRMMVGRELTDRFPKQPAAIGRAVLQVNHLTRQEVLRDVSLTVHAGEIVGVAGLMGAGRTELARALFGADPIDSGRIVVDGQDRAIRSPRDAIAAGIGLITEDRKQQGLVLSMSVGDNLSLAALKEVCRRSFISGTAETGAVQEQIATLKIKTPSEDQLVKNLSGGNQQKVVIGKWLLTKPKVLIMDEPTRGVDVGAKTEIYQIMNMLTAAGVGILMISSELPEILGMSDRILVMHRGRIAGELAAVEATQEEIMAFAAGG
ncbi:sugar ABC transporter ATP-binding protein [Propionispora hippei]|uniref:Ribose transport system ATP-binding protein n=1 Tax=Propionispora hippei DSM 15287 TaxID=1123003 RepID=A0A1M6HWD8_9FIRM|nr:sugar ABC transporter ATP-binding protein [Propionispora hippei]SHJ26532.1 ribose transport system ATP-binding protein [Propionispora hippei DSM 15287]